MRLLNLYSNYCSTKKIIQKKKKQKKQNRHTQEETALSVHQTAGASNFFHLLPKKFPIFSSFVKEPVAEAGLQSEVSAIFLN